MTRRTDNILIDRSHQEELEKYRRNKDWQELVQCACSYADKHNRELGDWGRIYHKLSICLEAVNEMIVNDPISARMYLRFASAFSYQALLVRERLEMGMPYKVLNRLMTADYTLCRLHGRTQSMRNIRDRYLMLITPIVDHDEVDDHIEYALCVLRAFIAMRPFTDHYWMRLLYSHCLPRIMRNPELRQSDRLEDVTWYEDIATEADLAADNYEIQRNVLRGIKGSEP